MDRQPSAEPPPHQYQQQYQQPYGYQHPTAPTAMPPNARARDNTGLRIGLGLPLLLVPLAAALVAYVLPSLRTFQMSMESPQMIGEDAQPVGMENYEWLFTDGGLFDGLAALALPVLGTVVAGAVIAPLIAWGFHQAGAGVRMAARIVFGLAAIAFAPAAMAVAWVLDRYESQQGWGGVGLTDWFQLLSGVILGLGVLVALAAFRGGTDTGKRAATVVCAAALTAFALVAAGLQAFTPGYVVGIPAPPEQTPLMQLFELGFSRFDTGAASAVGVVLLGALAVLGLGAALLFALARTRIDVGPGAGEPRRFAPGSGVVSVLLLIAFAAGVTLSLRPWLGRITGESGSRHDATEVVVNTWGSAGITTAVAIVAALAGGFALGALRPLGEGSPWLLLLFAPWLFVGSGPLSIANYMSLADADGLNTFLAGAPRAWIAIPALFVFTALFRGLEDRRRQAVAAGTRPGKAAGDMFAAAWPMIALVAMAVWLVNAQDAIWQSVTGYQDYPTATSDLIEATFGNVAAGFDAGVGVGFPVVMLAVFALATVAAAVFYLPRVGIRIGRERPAA